ncbi:alpha/beta hydrolase [Cellvibrio mixtus]|uniref:alpha/beta hydrolase n=1 Tax=Cellvibrio mixtus TaxID=39650 RepID=UPI0005877AB9|nr:alpha/beta fold hydrolase [Cellvibrio mixtus]
MHFPFAKEELLMISGPSGQLQAALHQGDELGGLAHRPRLVILCHPHPVHGGTMDNKVVTTLMRTYRDVGIHVLRFNFRGVGKSEGVFDNAIGELDDLRAIVAWAQQNLPEAGLLLAGFSFGSSIAAQVSYEVSGVQHLSLVAPPVERYPYARDNQFPCKACVVQGDQDERVIARGVYDWVATLRGDVELLRYPGAGHFFHGYLTALKTDLTQILQRQLQ